MKTNNYSTKLDVVRRYINTGTDNNNERIYGVKVNESNKL